METHVIGLLVILYIYAGFSTAALAVTSAIRNKEPDVNQWLIGAVNTIFWPIGNALLVYRAIKSSATESREKRNKKRDLKLDVGLVRSLIEHHARGDRTWLRLTALDKQSQYEGDLKLATWARLEAVLCEFKRTMGRYPDVLEITKECHDWSVIIEWGKPGQRKFSGVISG